MLNKKKKKKLKKRKFNSSSYSDNITNIFSSKLLKYICLEVNFKMQYFIYIQ